MFKLKGVLSLHSDDQALGGADRIALLAKIDETGSITAAARAVGMSYKGAWDAIDAMNNLADEPLVTRVTGGKGGGGSQLTERGKRLIEAFAALEDVHRRFFEQFETGGLYGTNIVKQKRHFQFSPHPIGIARRRFHHR